MGELLTLGQATASKTIKAAMGVCPTSDQGIAYLNDSTRILMRRGNFWGTVQRIGICVYQGCVTWPRWVGTVLALKQCKHSIPVFNNWYSFMPLDQTILEHGFGMNISTGKCHGNAAIENDDTSPVFNPVPCNADYYVRAYPQSKTDAGKTITIYGTDYNGQEIRTTRPDGTIQEGVVITIAVPFGSSAFPVRHIYRVLKEVTNDVVRLYLYDPINNVLLDCAVYTPSETSPNYRHSRIHGFPRQVTSCSGAVGIDALIKLEFIAAQSDNDLVLISNLDALALMIRALRYREKGDLDAANGYEASAIRELNLELRDRYPLESIPVNVESFGTALPAYHGVGRIV